MKRLLLHNVDARLRQAVWKLYEASFPAEERRSLLSHNKAMSDNRFCPYVYLDTNSALLALCFYWEFSDFIYLEHFAVAEEYRNEGIGSLIISQFQRNDKAVILEIEPPIDEQTTKRLHFYERNSFLVTSFSFEQLKYRKNSNSLLLDLFCNQPMSKDLFKNFQTTLYRELSEYCE